MISRERLYEITEKVRRRKEITFEIKDYVELIKEAIYAQMETSAKNGYSYTNLSKNSVLVYGDKKLEAMSNSQFNFFYKAAIAEFIEESDCNIVGVIRKNIEFIAVSWGEESLDDFVEIIKKREKLVKEIRERQEAM